MVNTSIGEIAVHTKRGDVLLRPSFLSMSKIGNPKEIVETYKRLCSGFVGKTEISMAMTVIESCCDQPCDWLIGWLQPSWGDDRILVCQGEMPVEDMMIIARHLIKWGVAGNPIVTGDGSPMVKFDASEFVGCAVRHFNIPPSEAWEMTITEYQRIVEAGMERKESNDDVESFMDRMEDISRKRDEMIKAGVSNGH